SAHPVPPTIPTPKPQRGSPYREGRSGGAERSPLRAYQQLLAHGDDLRVAVSALVAERQGKCGRATMAGDHAAHDPERLCLAGEATDDVPRLHIPELVHHDGTVPPASDGHN